MEELQTNFNKSKNNQNINVNHHLIDTNSIQYQKEEAIEQPSEEQLVNHQQQQRVKVIAEFVEENTKIVNLIKINNCNQQFSS